MIGEVKDAKLKHCPFCGGRAMQENYVVEAAVYCTVCQAKIVCRHAPKVDTGIKASADAWNSRE